MVEDERKVGLNGDERGVLLFCYGRIEINVDRQVREGKEGLFKKKKKKLHKDIVCETAFPSHVFTSFPRRYEHALTNMHTFSGCSLNTRYVAPVQDHIWPEIVLSL